MTEIVIPERILDAAKTREVLVFCATCDIILYQHEKETPVSNYVANETMLGHAHDLGHRVVRVQPERVI